MAESPVSFVPEHPKNQASLLGHGKAERTLLSAYSSGRLPHAWMIKGPCGIGKATLAYRFARFLLREGQEEDNPPGMAGPRSMAGGLETSFCSDVNQRITAGAHADLTVLEKSEDDKGKKQTIIPVEEVRRAISFSHKTAAEGGWRVLIVDSLDDLNSNASNAILKLLEEPPKKTILLLVCHNPGKLLPTLHSRCCHLKLQPLSLDLVAEILGERLEALSAEEAKILAFLSEGSIGQAYELYNAGGTDLYRVLISLFQSLPQLEGGALYGFAERISSQNQGDSFKTGMGLFLWLLSRIIHSKTAAREPFEVLAGESDMLLSLSRKAALDAWLELWEKVNCVFQKAEPLNIDKKQAVLVCFADLKATIVKGGI